MTDGEQPTPPHTIAVVEKPASAELVRAAERVEFYRSVGRAESTQKAYALDWRRFVGWAEPLGLPVLPATPGTVAAHLAWLADEGFSITTLERLLSAASQQHKRAGFDWHRGHPTIAGAMEGIRRRIGSKRVKKAPVGVELLVAACSRLPVDRKGLMNRALLTVGWFAALRSANLVAIEREHLSFVPEGMIVHLPQSKTDQRKVGRDVAIHYQPNESACPVMTTQAYLHVAGITRGLVFDVSKKYVSRLVKWAAANPEHGHPGIRGVEACPECAARARSFGSHSLRHGLITAAAKTGSSAADIMRQSGHKSEKVMQGYVQFSTLFERNVTKDLVR